MHPIEPDDAGQQEVDQFEKMIIALRKEKAGLTADTIAKHPALLEALGTDDPAEAAERLRELARNLDVEEPEDRVAVCGNLAIDFDAGAGAEDRYRRMRQAGPHKTPLLTGSDRTARRRMEDGAKALALAIWRYKTSAAEAVAAAIQPGLLAIVRDTKNDTSATTLSAPVEPPDHPRRRRLWLIGGAFLVAVAVVIAAVFIPWPGSEEEPTITPPTGVPAPDPALMAKYDGHDPRGSEPDGSPGVRCANPPPSEPVEGVNSPPVIGPEGKVVGVIRLRRSPLCSTIWARVLWNDDENALYKVPDGWILHVVIHRPSTHTAIDAMEPEAGKPPNAGPIQFALSRMLTTQPGCIFAEAYFTKDNMRTNIAVTSCVN